MHTRRLMAVLALVTGLVLSGATTPVRAVDSDGDGVDDFHDVCDNTPTGTAVDHEGRPVGDIDQDCDNDLADYALSQQGFTGPLAPFVVVDTVLVDNPGNAYDTHGDGYGGVDYEFNVATFEVTAGQYTEFLNAVAASDPYELYDPTMWSSSYGCQIERTGSADSYMYNVAPDRADRPVNQVNWGDAARFSNWLHNGQLDGILTGDPTQDAWLTEDGSYFLNGATSDADLMLVTREPDATWVIPSEDEWYKAAYHKNDGLTGNYFDYPTSSDDVPSNDLLDPDPGNNATFDDGDYTIDYPYWRTEVGDHENSVSPYGTFDQGGNVWEWNEALIGSCRGLRGGSYHTSGGDLLHAAFRSCASPTGGAHSIGFRVAEVHESIPLGACCQPDGSCDVTTDADCTGAWTPDGVCDPNPCPQPGACCLADGSCTETFEVDCAGDWQGAGTTCEPNPCPQPGACCADDGTCTETLEVDCADNWLGEGTICEPNQCPQPGACCADDGTCTETLEVDCADNWFGEGTICDPNPCPQPGACCLPDGSCMETFEVDCAGNWQGAGTTCEPNQCPQPGACCADDGTCTETLEVDCADNWLGAGTVCDPNPCSAPPVVIDTVSVGNEGNAHDTRYETPGYGGVDYEFNIGTFEVTAGQYTAFLNAVADDDIYVLYSENMWNETDGCKIERTGSWPNYEYSVAADMADRPVNYVSWGDAARFANWLHNDQPTGSQNLTTTEDGSYYLDGATSDAALIAVTREPDATWVIPSEDEWYKAAYHKNDGVTGNYWDYPTESDTAPTSEGPPGTDMINGSANYDNVIGSPRTEVGAYDAKPSDSPYGTFDQGGNVWEWNEAIISGSSRCLRGGSLDDDSDRLRANLRTNNVPTMEAEDRAFRVAEVTGSTLPGACCLPDGSCTETFEVDCAGDWQGAGTTCEPNQCPQPGACCADDGTCTETLEVDCADNWLGEGTICDPNPCAAPPLVIETVPVGNWGNADDTHGNGYGGVDYEFNIGTFEVTAGQYCRFLNAVAASDPYLLYSASMDSGFGGCQITQLGTDGNFTYDFSGGTVEAPGSTAADWEDRPVNYVSWGDAARFANWLHNGQPTETLTGVPAQDAWLTEDGSYFLNGAMTNVELMAITRHEAGATWVIPSEDEWYKAAYHKNDGVTGNYWDYPTESDTAPTLEAPPGTDMTNGSANYMEGVDYAIGSPYYRTEVGAYDARPSASPYGTFDQGGNVLEWNEAMVDWSYRGVRGGSFGTYGSYMHAVDRNLNPPTDEYAVLGFRVSEVP